MSVESSKKICPSQMCNHTSTEIFRQQRGQDLEQMDPSDKFRGPFKNN